MKNTIVNKARASKEAKKTAHSKQCIQIGPSMRLMRFNDLNWAIIRKGHEKEPYFYGRLIDALKDIPHKLLRDGEWKTLQDILKRMEQAQKTVEIMCWNKELQEADPI